MKTLTPKNTAWIGILSSILLAAASAADAASTEPAPAAASAPKALEAASPTDEPAKGFNGYAEKLKPKVKRSAKVSSQPYQPIKNVPPDPQEVAEIEMFVGESRVFPTPGVGRIAVGNGAILTAAALDDKETILFANAPGVSSLFIWNEDGRYQRVKIHIVPGDVTRYAREISAFLTFIPGAKTSIIGDKVIVEGDNLKDVDLAKIEDLAKRYPQIVNFTNRLGWEQMVMLDVKVVEFPTNELKQIGLSWTAQGGSVVGAIWSPGRRGDAPNLQVGINNPPITNPSGTSVQLPNGLNILSAINMGLGSTLNLLAQEGRSRTLAEPQLSARNGSKASFLAGGEYPYTVSTINGPTVLFKPYGVRLDITPRVDRNGVIRANVDTEVSSIDSSISTPAGPALSTRRTTTEFNVHAGETLVLSGLIQRSLSNSLDKVPGLGDIPLLGELFRSRRYQNNETELVVFVTPTVISADSAGMQDRVDQTNKRVTQPVNIASTLPEAPPATPEASAAAKQGATAGL